MRNFIQIAILSLIWIDSFGQNGNQSIESFNFLAKPDSIISEKQHGYIYLTSDTTSRLYNWIIPNPDNKYMISIYADYIKHIKKNFQQNMVINKIQGFPRKWNSVYVYKNKYFLYGPSDWMMNTGYYISDSVIYITKSDPSDLYFILDFKQKSTELTEISIIDYFGERNKIQIRLVDSNYGFYIWTFFNQDSKLKTQYLMQDSKFSKRLPMIVCDCGDEKCFMVFEFDKPDFNRLTNKK